LFDLVVEKMTLYDLVVEKEEKRKDKQYHVFFRRQNFIFKEW